MVQKGGRAWGRDQSSGGENLQSYRFNVRSLLGFGCNSFICTIMQTHLSQVENDYKERLEGEVSARNQFEKVDMMCFQFEEVKMFLSPSLH